MSVFVARPLSPRRHVVAEGPVWNANSGTVMWVDIERGAVFEGVLEGDSILDPTERAFDRTVGVAAPGPEGSLLVAGERRLMVVAANGTVSDGPEIIGSDDPSRLNDGAVDPAGRFLVGTMAFDAQGGSDRLVVIDEDGSMRVLDSDLGISNGIAWSPDGRTLYNVDTLAGKVWARDYDPATGSVGLRRSQLDVDGMPDGICVDVEGRIWVAVWGSGEVRCYEPTGAIAHTVHVGVPHVSSACFVGESRDRLFITTASRDLDEGGLALYPDAGCVFIADVGVRGAATYAWSGSW